ncbi:EboA domain-containing protein [Algoriphagus halophytocola]|uniref:EboA domain-containing protein n=1 Tax=Algoriphagus halophytocola TaxID=2991499 RepID=A0ABY6MCI2_9BACT|nr:MULTISPECIES: EboA domain-containing protein [unclassified Algoriphagus]UZD21402.1 EboA domain-containing protein [Algoriphagus sp. TR-M5]WBL42615.1 EboA domain-containing protein [Algoriphagus sp. TR-M9]
MQDQVSNFLIQLLQAGNNSKGLNWLEKQTQKISSEPVPAKLFLAFSQASRFFKKEKLELSVKQLEQADQLCSGFEPNFWDELQTARAVLLLSYKAEKETWFKTVNQLFETADMYEHQALFAALPVLPFQEDLIPRAIDGLRTNISLVFDAIALNNPFPAKYFPEANWNQMILKAIFMQRPLYKVQGLEERRNPDLAAIARDFAHERWAAGRDVMPEIWRLVAPFVDEMFMSDLQKALESQDELQMKAVLLALRESAYGPAEKQLEQFPELVAKLDMEAKAWKSIGEEFQQTRV